MDKTDRALCGVEDNAESIRALFKRLTAVESSGGSAEIDAVRTRVDRAETDIARVAAGIEDTAEELGAVNTRLGGAEADISGLTAHGAQLSGDVTALASRMGVAETNLHTLSEYGEALDGRLTEVEAAVHPRTDIYLAIVASTKVGSADRNNFGTFRIDGPTAIFIKTTATTGQLIFNNRRLVSGASPLITVLSSGEGELFFLSNTTATLLLIGSFTKLS